MATLSGCMHAYARAHARVWTDNGADAPCVILGAGLNWEKKGRWKGMR